MGRQSKAVELFLEQSEHGKYKHINPKITGDGEYRVTKVKRPDIGESGIGLPVCFDLTIQKVDVRGGTVRISHPAIESAVPVLSTTWVQVAKGAHATIIEEIEGTGTAVQSGISVITTAHDAVVDYVRAINLSENQAGIFKCVIEAMGPMLRAWQVINTAGFVDTGLSIRLLTQDSHVNVMNIAMSNGQGEIYDEISASHDARRTQSEVLSRALAFDNSNISGKGKAILPEIAKGAVTAVDMKGLLMGEGSITMVPKLEINQLDVIAGHGAAIGPLDPLAMFYLNSRGIDQAQSRRLLLAAFVMPLLAGLPSDTIVKAVMDDLNRHIGG